MSALVPLISAPALKTDLTRLFASISLLFSRVAGPLTVSAFSEGSCLPPVPLNSAPALKIDLPRLFASVALLFSMGPGLPHGFCFPILQGHVCEHVSGMSMHMSVTFPCVHCRVSIVLPICFRVASVLTPQWALLANSILAVLSNQFLQELA